MTSFRNPRESDAPRRRSPTIRMESNREINDGKNGQKSQSRGFIYESEATSRRDLYVPVAYPVAHTLAHPVAVPADTFQVEPSANLLESGSWESSERGADEASVFQESALGTATSSYGGEFSVYSQAQSQVASEPADRQSRHHRKPSGVSSRHTRNPSSSEDPWAGPGRQEADTDRENKRTEQKRGRVREGAAMHDLPPYPYQNRQESERSGLSHDLEGFSDFNPSVADSAAHGDRHDRHESYPSDTTASRGVYGPGGGDNGGRDEFRPSKTGAEAAAAAEATNAAAAQAAREKTRDMEKEERARRQAQEAAVSGKRKGGGRKLSSVVQDRGDTKDEAESSIGGSSAFRQSAEQARRSVGDPYAPPQEYAVIASHCVVFTPAIFFICAILLIWEFSLNEWVAEDLATNPSLGPSVETLIEAGAKRTDLITDDGEWWRLISPMFLHAGVIHFIFNMVGFVQIGAMVERVFGWWRVGSIYMLAGIFGTIVSAIFIPSQVMVGASGAIFGVFGALWADLWQNWRIYSGKCRTLTVLAMLTVINIILGLMPYLDNFAHIGGMVMGFLMGLMLLVQGREDERGLPVDTKCYQRTLQLVSATMVLVLLVTGLSLLYGRSDPSDWCGWCDNISCIEFPVADPWWACDECSISGFSARAFDNGTISIACPDQSTMYSETCSSATDDALIDCCIGLCL